MPDPNDWSLTTFEGNRARQRAAFLALSFREKLARVEQMNEVVRHFAAKRSATDGDQPLAPKVWRNRP